MQVGFVIFLPKIAHNICFFSKTAHNIYKVHILTELHTTTASVGTPQTKQVRPSCWNNSPDE
jgi:hypothetical protein